MLYFYSYVNELSSFGINYAFGNVYKEMLTFSLL